MKTLFLVLVIVMAFTSCALADGSETYVGTITPGPGNSAFLNLYGTDGSSANIFIGPGGSIIGNTYSPPSALEHEIQSQRTQRAIDSLQPAPLKFHGFAPGEVIHLND